MRAIFGTIFVSVATHCSPYTSTVMLQSTIDIDDRESTARSVFHSVHIFFCFPFPVIVILIIIMPPRKRKTRSSNTAAQEDAGLDRPVKRQAEAQADAAAATQTSGSSASIKAEDNETSSSTTTSTTTASVKHEADGAASSASSASVAAPTLPTVSPPAPSAAFASAAVSASPLTKSESLDDEDEDEEEIKWTPQSHLDGLARTPSGHLICPYLDTIDRKSLDFDFEKVCSVTLSTANVYACLVCGRYFQGRGRRSHAYAHALDVGHHVFINLHTQDIYCLPDGYEVFDPSLDDIKFNLAPKYTMQDIARLDGNTRFVHALDGSDYLPGLVGLNNIKNTDWLNVLVQALNTIPMFRHYFLYSRRIEQEKQEREAAAKPRISSVAAAASIIPPAARRTDLVDKFGELIAKLWNWRSFKGHVSPHELLQTISTLSSKQYTIGKFCDVLQVLSWMMHEMNREMGGPKKKKKPSIIHHTFQGEIRVTTEIMPTPEEESAEEEKKETDMNVGGSAGSSKSRISVEHRPFLYLSLALPAAPLFQSSTDRAILPQVPLFDLLRKFDGRTVDVSVDPETKREIRRTYTITKLPPYLILHYQRFHQNNWFWEKNPTLVNFPLKQLDMKQYTTGMEAKEVPTEAELAALSVGELKKRLDAKHVSHVNVLEKRELVSLLLAASQPPSTRYDLIANIVHDGKPNKELSGSYKCHVLHAASDTWYATEDLHVWTTETMPQLVALSEAYMQVYQLSKPKGQQTTKTESATKMEASQ